MKVRALAGMLAFAAVYYLAARLGLQFALVRGQVTPLWPVTGIALVCLLLFDVRVVAAGIAVGAFIVNATVGPSIVAAAIIAVGNTGAPLAGYLLLRRAGFRIELDRLRDALSLVFLGALLAMSISATIGSTTLLVAGAVTPAHFVSTWSVWWTGDAMGVLVFTPLLLVLRTQGWRVRHARPMRWAELAVLLIGAAAVAVLAGWTPVHPLFLTLPFVTWAALRFQHLGAAPCAALISVIAVLAAVNHAGAFSSSSVLANMIMLQLFNGTVALTALLLSTITAERDQARRAIESACVQLTDALTHRQAVNGNLVELVRATARTRKSPLR